MNVLSLFDGMSCGQIALERAGIKVDYYWASEINKYAKKVALDNYPKTIHLPPVEEIISRFYPVDLLLAGSPCQGFSFAGKRLALDDPRSKLYFEFERIKNECKPTWWLLENVKMTEQHRLIISRRLGVDAIEINSSLVSGQNRKRYYWTNIPFDMPEDKGITWQKALGLSEECMIIGKGRGKRRNGFVKNQTKSPTLTSSSWQCNHWIYSPYHDDYIKFLPHHFEKLQTVPRDYTACVSNLQRYKMLGNGWTVDVIAHILRGINKN